jgi:hypothetical protein
MTSRDWRSAFLSALITSVIAAFGGDLPAAQSRTHVAVCNVQSDGSFSLNQQTPTEPAGHDTAHNALLAWTARFEDARPHSTSTWTATADDDDSSDSNDDDDDDPDDVPSVVLGQAPPSLTADHGHTLLSIRPEIDRHASFESDGHSLRAPPQ